jgi:hypothetical protein
VTVSWSGIGAPTSTDWVAIAPAGGPDANWVAWGYTNGATSGSRTITLPSYTAPGSYSARFLANDTYTRLAVSNTIDVQPPTVVANPTAVAAGGTLTVSWQNVGSPTPKDWLALVPSGAADTGWVTWIYGSGQASGSVVFPLPSTLSAGSYDIRLFSNDSVGLRLAVSNPITIAASGPSIAVSPVTTTAGGTLTANWRNIASPTPTDWVGVYPVGAADANFVIRAFTGGRASDRTLMTLPGSMAAGTYELRLFANNTLTRLATSNSFNVTAGPSLSASPMSVAAGGTLNVSWSAIATPTPKDWFVLVPVGAVDSNWLAWKYTDGTATGSTSLPIPTTVPMGTYELRLLANDGWQRLAVSNLIRVGPTVVGSPTTAAPGGTLTVAWAGIPTPTPTDWFALTPINAPDTNWVAWIYTNGRAADSLIFTLPANLPAGNYDLRLLANNAFNRLAISNVITVAPGPSLATVSILMTGSSSLPATWQGIASPSVNNWIGLYPVGAPDANYIRQVFTNGQASGSTSITPGALTPGSYELRLFADSGFTRLAVSNSFTVVPGPSVHASPSTVAKGGTVTVTWEGIVNPMPGDWFALAPVGSDDSVYLSWQYSGGTASGTINLVTPPLIPSGAYEVRLFANNTMQKLAVSNVITVP